MLKQAKKYYFGVIFILLSGFLFFAFPKVSFAVDSSYRQVKSASSPTVYYLDHRLHLKKAYVNEKSYLSYGNKWSDIKILEESELATWPEIKLVKIRTSPGVYYVKGKEKALLLSWSDLQDFGLEENPIVVINETDLAQYNSVSYETIGLNNIDSSINQDLPVSQTEGLLVINDLVNGANNNTLVAGTANNLIASYRFRASKSALTINSITINFSGVYDSQILDALAVNDEQENIYKVNARVNSSARQGTINFYEPLSLELGEEKTVNVYLSLKSCTDCANQTIRAEIKSASDIISSAKTSTNFPLPGTLFKLMSGEGLLGNISVQELSLQGENSATVSSSRTLGKFKISETSGVEDALIKQMSFSLGGSASRYDLGDYRLIKDGQIISRSDSLTNGKLIFSINYLRLPKSSFLNLSVVASLQTDYRKDNTFNLTLDEVLAEGKDKNLFLQTKISNLEEVFSFN